MQNISLNSWAPQQRQATSVKANKGPQEDWAKLIDSKRNEMFGDLNKTKVQEAPKVTEVKQANNLWALNGYTKSNRILNFSEDTIEKTDTNKRVLGSRLDLLV